MYNRDEPLVVALIWPRILTHCNALRSRPDAALLTSGRYDVPPGQEEEDTEMIRKSLKPLNDLVPRDRYRTWDSRIYVPSSRTES